MADETAKLKVSQISAVSARSSEVDNEDRSKVVPSFLHNGRFSVLAILCSLPLVHFGGERLFGVATLCLLAVYMFNVSLSDTRSSIIVYMICLLVMQFSTLYAIGPLLWNSVFNIILLFLYNVFVVLTGGLGLVQFKQFRKDEIAFCANVEYFLFLAYPPACLLILVWISSQIYGSHIAPYLFILLGFPICHTFLDPKVKCSFVEKDCILGQPEKLLAIFNFIFCPAFSYFLVNFSYLLQYSSWIAMLFLITVPLFLVTFLDTLDLRDIVDIKNYQWQLLQLVSGSLAMVLGNILLYIHGVVDGPSAVVIAVILLCSMVLFGTVKYRHSHLASSIFTCLLLLSYFGWFYLLPWNLIFSLGNTIKMSMFTIELLVAFLGLLSVLAVALSISVRYRRYLNQVLLLHTAVFVLVEEVLTEAEGYSIFIMMATALLMLYMVQRLHYVGHLTKTTSLLCVSFHGSKLVIFVTTTGLHQHHLTTATFLSCVFGGFALSFAILGVMVFEHKQKIQKQKALFYSGCFLASLVVLSPTFLRLFWLIVTNQEPSTADSVGFVLVTTALFVAKLTYLHMDEGAVRKYSVIPLVLGVMTIVLQPDLNILKILSHVPKFILRETFFESWQIILAEFLILPLWLLFSVLLTLSTMLKLFQIKTLSFAPMNVLSFLIGAPFGLLIAHKVLPYPDVPSTVLSLPYMISTWFTTHSFLVASRHETTTTTTTPLRYFIFMLVSVLSITQEVRCNVTIAIARASLPPSFVFQLLLHLIKILQLKSESAWQTSMDIKESMFPSVACNFSVMFIFGLGLLFAPQDYFDILAVPLCASLLLLRMDKCLEIKRSQFSSNMLAFILSLSGLLFGRSFGQLTWGKFTFWTTIAFLLETLLLTNSVVVMVILVAIYWFEKMTSLQERGLVFLCPACTILFFYGRTQAFQVLGIVSPCLAYYTFYYAFT